MGRRGKPPRDGLDLEGEGRGAPARAAAGVAAAGKRYRALCVPRTGQEAFAGWRPPPGPRLLDGSHSNPNYSWSTPSSQAIFLLYQPFPADDPAPKKSAPHRGSFDFALLFYYSPLCRTILPAFSSACFSRPRIVCIIPKRSFFPSRSIILLIIALPVPPLIPPSSHQSFDFPLIRINCVEHVRYLYLHIGDSTLPM